MPFTTNYTPYAATGQLATAAGVAQQKVRDQQYAEAERAQQAQIAANQTAQAQSIAANRELQTQQLLQQQKQFSATQALNQQTVSANTASQYGSLYNTAFQNYSNMFANVETAGLNQQKMDAIQQQTALENKYKAKTFELEEAATARAVEKQDLANERQSILNLTGVQDYNLTETKAGQQTEAYEYWKELYESGQIDNVTYGRGLVDIASGKSPQPSAAEKGLTAYQQSKEEKAKTATFTDNDIMTYTKLAESTMGAYTDKETGELDAPTKGWFGPTMTQDDVEKRYDSFRTITGYEAKNPVQQKQLDGIFDNTVNRINTATGDEYQFRGTIDYNQKQMEIKTLADNIGVVPAKTSGQSIDLATASKIVKYANGDKAKTNEIIQQLGFVDVGTPSKKVPDMSGASGSESW